MNDYELERRIDSANSKMVSADATTSSPIAPPQQSTEMTSPLPAPIDVYQAFSDAQYNESQTSRPHGSSTLVKGATEAAINGEGGYDGLARAYREMKRDCDYLKGQGENKRIELVKQQYLMEKFLPAVEVVVNTTSPDELLNCKEALSAFDKFAPTIGAGDGFTAAYIKQAYGDVLGQQTSDSDPAVIDAVRRIEGLVADGQIRAAYGLAQKMKKQIDNGEHIAGEADYSLIGRMANFA